MMERTLVTGRIGRSLGYWMERSEYKYHLCAPPAALAYETLRRYLLTGPRGGDSPERF